MQKDTTSHQQLAGLISLFKRGIICPSLMWIPLFEELASNDVQPFLDGLDSKLQAFILEEYQGLASYRFLPSWYMDYPISTRETILAIKQWCENRLRA